jgi:hypothetical protein
MPAIRRKLLNVMFSGCLLICGETILFAQEEGGTSLPDVDGRDAQSAPSVSPNKSDNEIGTNKAVAACLPLSARESFEAGEFRPDNPIYPVTTRFDFSPLEEGEEILAIRKVECDGARSFVLFTKGLFQHKDPNGSVVFKRTQNLAVVNNFNQSGEAWNFAVSSASKDINDTWCLPKKEFCTKKVDRRAHGLKDTAQAEISVADADAYSLRHGEDLAIQAVVTKRCGKPPVPVQACINLGMTGTLCQPITFEQAVALFPALQAPPEMKCPEAATVSPAPVQAQPETPEDVQPQ